MFEPSVIVSLMNGVTPSSNVVNRTDAMLSRNVNRDSESLTPDIGPCTVKVLAEL